MSQGQVQQFASAPQAVSNARFRSPDETSKINNLMHDRRVVRGNTHTSMVQSQPDAAELRKQREAQRRRIARSGQKGKRAGTPEPLAGRKHMDIQTDSYLEELTERTVEFEAETQTDFLLDRPPSPLFMPAKIGVDIETQIEEGELFDFDVECEPVLEVLVGKTLEQSMMEVLEEEELESLRRHQEEFEKRRNAELLEAQRMEAAEKRRSDEMARRMQQQTAQKERDMGVMRKVVSRSIAAMHLGSIKERTLAHLKDAGCFADSVQLASDIKFMPDLLKAVLAEVDQAVKDRNIFADILNSAISTRLATHDARLETERRRLAAIDQAEREAREEIARERKACEAEAERIKAEQDAMVDWEQYVPPPPKVSDVQIKEVNDENKAVCGGEGLVATIPADKLEELRTLLASTLEANETREAPPAGEEPAPDQIVCGKVAVYIAVEDGAAPEILLESFRAGTLADLAAGDAAAEATATEALAGEAA